MEQKVFSNYPIMDIHKPRGQIFEHFAPSSVVVHFTNEAKVVINGHLINPLPPAMYTWFMNNPKLNVC